MKLLGAYLQIVNELSIICVDQEQRMIFVPFFSSSTLVNTFDKLLDDLLPNFFHLFIFDLISIGRQKHSKNYKKLEQSYQQIL